MPAWHAHPGLHPAWVLNSAAAPGTGLDGAFQDCLLSSHLSEGQARREPQALSRGLINGTTRTFLSGACPVCLPHPCPQLHIALAPTCIHLPEGGLRSQPCAATPARGPAPPPAPPMAASLEPRVPGVQLLAAAPGLLGGHPGDLMARGSIDNQEIPKAEDSSLSPHRAHSLG